MPPPKSTLGRPDYDWIVFGKPVNMVQNAEMDLADNVIGKQVKIGRRLFIKMIPACGHQRRCAVFVVLKADFTFFKGHMAQNFRVLRLAHDPKL